MVGDFEGRYILGSIYDDEEINEFMEVLRVIKKDIKRIVDYRLPEMDGENTDLVAFLKCFFSNFSGPRITSDTVGIIINDENISLFSNKYDLNDNFFRYSSLEIDRDFKSFTFTHINNNGTNMQIVNEVGYSLDIEDKKVKSKRREYYPFF